MGCFSFLCNKSMKAAESTSFDGSACHLFLLKDGLVMEHMYGNYDSYGSVFRKGKAESFQWEMDWSDVCDLMFDKPDGNGIAMILDEHYNGTYPTKQSNQDPNQGWGDDLSGMGDVSKNVFKEVDAPYHKILRECRN